MIEYLETNCCKTFMKFTFFSRPAKDIFEYVKKMKTTDDQTRQ